ncbi:LPS assembly lipoprotein LptE [Marinicella sp. W31]|uniref:LPS-assembly lipoprotein LptE n=1 Tax=Marinicella sp. W31 TaxID=3023713 RepID=UPI0037565724
MKKTVLILWLIGLLLTACGYQLRQPVELNTAYQKTYLALSITSPLYQPLYTELLNAKIDLVKTQDQSSAELKVNTVNLERVIQSIGANNRVQEYRLEINVNFQVLANGENLVEPQTLNMSRDYAFDIEQITGTQQEEAILREQLYKDMARMIVTRISRQP